MKWTDGSTYIGEWQRGIQHGYGKIVLADGTTKEGYFENNLYLGPTTKLIKNKSQNIESPNKNKP